MFVCLPTFILQLEEGNSSFFRRNRKDVGRCHHNEKEKKLNIHHIAVMCQRDCHFFREWNQFGLATELRLWRYFVNILIRCQQLEIIRSHTKILMSGFSWLETCAAWPDCRQNLIGAAALTCPKWGLLSTWSPSWITALLWRRGFCNSMKLWAMLCGATQDRQATVRSSN